MDEMWRENKWKDRPKKVYPDVYCKDAPVPPALPVPNCDCGKAAHVTQSMHHDTAAWAYYSCPNYRDREMCYFFNGLMAQRWLTQESCFLGKRLKNRTTSTSVGCLLHQTHHQ